MELFKKLSDSETQEFIQWAQENYVPFSPIEGTWHPVVQATCAAINAKFGTEAE